MLIALSIVDKHRPAGLGHLGTVLVEVDIPVEDTHYDIAGWVVAKEQEDLARKDLNRVMSREDIMAQEGGAVNGLGEPVE